MRMPIPLHSPLFNSEHRVLCDQLRSWGASNLADHSHDEGRTAVDARCRNLVKALGSAGFLKYCVPSHSTGAASFDLRSIVLIREHLAWYDGLADFAFAMQGLGSGAITLAGSPELKSRYLPPVAAGDAVAAFALSEAQAGSDVAAMSCEARAEGDSYILNGAKTWISNGGIADFYCVFARTSPPEIRGDGSTAARGISAFVIDSGQP